MTAQAATPPQKAIDAVLEPSGSIALYKAEQETQNSIARANPRNPRKALEEALLELEIVPEYACKAFYKIPFKDRSDGDEKTVYVEGPSIKASQALARVWGNNASGWRVVDQGAERIEIEGVYVDHQTNTRTLRTKTVSRFYVERKSKNKVELREDALVKAIAAGGSKAVRDATLAGLPVWFVDSYYQKARTIAAQNIGGRANTKKPTTYAEKLAWVEAQLVKKGVTPEQFKGYVDGLDKDQAEDERIADIIGIYNAIADGQIKLEDVFTGKTYTAPNMTPAGAAGKGEPKTETASIKIKSVATTDFNGEDAFVIREDKDGGRKFFTADPEVAKRAKKAGTDGTEAVVVWFDRTSGEAKGAWIKTLTVVA